LLDSGFFFNEEAGRMRHWELSIKKRQGRWRRLVPLLPILFGFWGKGERERV
jgi:hypothetical protein